MTAAHNFDRNMYNWAADFDTGLAAAEYIAFAVVDIGWTAADCMVVLAVDIVVAVVADTAAGIAVVAAD